MPSKTKNDRQVFNFFMEFLRSDIWQIPICEFMERRSIVFERESDLSEVPDTANCYQNLHQEFGKMVSDLLEAYCQDSELTRERLMEALKATDQADKLTQKERILLEPIVAAQDFDVFVPMMMRKNIELQLQALRMIEHLNGPLPSSLKLAKEDAEIWEALFDEDESDRLILITVLKQSKEEWEKDQKMHHDWQAQMEEAIRESLREKAHLEELRKREQTLLEQALSKANNSLKNLNLASEQMGKGRPVEEVKANENGQPQLMSAEKPKEEQPSEEKAGNRLDKFTRESGPSLEEDRIRMQRRSVANVVEHRKAEEGGDNDTQQKQIEQQQSAAEGKKAGKRLSLGQVHFPPKGIPRKEQTVEKGDLAYRALLKERNKVPEEAVQSRVRYLREQRDKLLQKKSREREKQLLEAAKQMDQSRPRTAQAARGVMEQGTGGGEGELEERRRIAAKIKAEVIDKGREEGERSS